MALKLYVGNIPFQTTEDRLKEVFSAHGEVTEVTIVKDKFSGRSRGFAFVEFADDAAGKAAIDALNGFDLDGRKIVVNESRPMEKRERKFDRPRRSFDDRNQGGFDNN